LAVLEKEQSRDRSDVVLERETLIFIHVHFRYLDRARFFARSSCMGRTIPPRNRRSRAGLPASLHGQNWIHRV